MRRQVPGGAVEAGHVYQGRDRPVCDKSQTLILNWEVEKEQSEEWSKLTLARFCPCLEDKLVSSTHLQVYLLDRGRACNPQGCDCLLGVYDVSFVLIILIILFVLNVRLHCEFGAGHPPGPDCCGTYNFFQFFQMNSQKLLHLTFKGKRPKVQEKEKRKLKKKLFQEIVQVYIIKVKKFQNILL